MAKAADSGPAVLTLTTLSSVTPTLLPIHWYAMVEVLCARMRP